MFQWWGLSWACSSNLYSFLNMWSSHVPLLDLKTWRNSVGSLVSMLLFGRFGVGEMTLYLETRLSFRMILSICQKREWHFGLRPDLKWMTTQLISNIVYMGSRKSKSNAIYLSNGWYCWFWLRRACRGPVFWAPAIVRNSCITREGYLRRDCRRGYQRGTPRMTNTIRVSTLK